MGVNVLITRFFKGFGRKLEEQEWAEAQAFVQNANSLGLRVWGYLQGGSLFGETLFIERPDARDWIAKTAEGKDLVWGASYFRFMPCLNHPDYQSYFHELLRVGIEKLGFDGVHIDNSYYRGCYCERCRDLFRQWLNERGNLDELLGLSDASAVTPPPLHSPHSLITDPLRVLWVAFSVEVRHRFYREAFRRLKQLKSEAQLCANPAFPRNLSSRRNLSLDPSIEGEICDFLFAENGNQPGWQGRLLSQAEAHLLAEAGGYRTLSTTWRHLPNAWRHGQPTSSPPGTPGAVWAGLAEEFSYQSATLGNNWMTRPAGDSGQMLLDVMPELMEAFAQGMAFFRNLEMQVRLQERRTWAEYGILLNPSALSLIGQTAGEVSRAVIRYFQLRRLPFRILFSARDAPQEMRHIVACHQLCLPNGEVEALADFARAPRNRVTLLGDVGRYNEWFLRREESQWRSFIQQPGVCYKPLSLPAPGEDAKSHFAAGKTRVSRELKQALDSALIGRQTRLSGPHQLLINIEAGRQADFYIHVRDQTEQMRTVRAKVFVGDLYPSETDTDFIYFDGKPKRRRTTPDPDGWLTLPDFQKYCLMTTSTTLP